MHNNISGIREKLLTNDFFKKCSQYLIQLYKSDDFTRLNEISNQIFPEIDNNNIKDDNKKLFYSLIKIFHPDSYKLHLNRFNEAVSDIEVQKIDFYSRMTSMKTDENIFQIKDDFNYEEYYVYQEDEYRSWIFNEGESPDISIVNLISKLFMGNSDKYPEPAALSHIEGELILSDLYIKDLAGLQYCTGVTNLDLSHNKIADINEIKSLSQLEELDISSNCITNIDSLTGLDNLEILYLDFNQIEDFSVLLKLKELKFVSITANPVLSSEQISCLKDKGIIVVDS